MLRFGLFGDTCAPPRGEHVDRRLDELFAEAQLAEQVGFDSMLIGEHHQQAFGLLPSPFLVDTAIALRTQRLRVGTGVLLLPLYHPVHVAEDAATLDVISKGRVILGVGQGYQPLDFEAFGVTRGQRAPLLEEGIEIIRRCWAGDDVTFHGQHYHLEHLSLHPKPLQKPTPPIWIGGTAEVPVQRAGRLGDGWITDPIQERHEIKALATAYRKAAIEAGRTPYVVLMREAWVSTSKKAAQEEYGPLVLRTLRYYYRNNLGAFGPHIRSLADITIEAVSDKLIWGSPEECVEQIQRWQEEIRMEYLVLMLRQATGPAHERVLQAIHTFGERVIPRLA